MNVSPSTDLKSNAGAMAALLRSMSHPERLLIFCRMDDVEVAASELVDMTGLSQSSVSQHFAVLREAGAINVPGGSPRRLASIPYPIVCCAA